MTTGKDMYRADQVGSLLRPPEVLRARAEHEAGRLSLDKLRDIEDEAILGALELQREAGVDVLTDGEFRRSAWQTDFAEAVEGFEREYLPMQWHGPDAEGTNESYAQVVGARLRQHRRLTLHESGFLKLHAFGPYKVTMPSPTTFRDASYKPGLTDRVYPTRASLLAELVQIIRGEVAALIAEGVPYIQLDAPRLSYYVDPAIRESMQRTGVDSDQALDEAIEGENACLSGLPRDNATIGFHICRGNNRSRWRAEGGYDPIAEKVFSSLQHDRFLLEYDSERAGGFEPLRFVPRGKTVVLGLVTTKQGQLERKDDLLRRIDEASKYVPLQQLALSPQCGFASVAEGHLLSPDQQRRKLELVAEVARQVWG
jgi:5-methyltetrahydropteroyltriglutamate--homocysteine methyltransferase